MKRIRLFLNDKAKVYLALISMIFTYTFNNLYSQDNEFKLFGGNGVEEGRALIQTPDGNYMVAGRTRSFGSGSDDYYLIKLNTQFDVLFENPFGGPHHDRCQSIIYFDNGTYGLFGQSWDFMPGISNFNLTIVNAFGDFVDRKMFYQKGRDLGLKIIKTSDNGFVMVGTVKIAGFWNQMYIMKTDEDFNMIWEQDFGASYRKDYAYDVIENESGYLLIGTYSGFYGMYATIPDFQEESDIGIIQLDSDGNTLWSYKYDGDNYDFGYSICQVDDIIYALGSTKSEGAGSFDILLIALDTDGNLLNSFTYGDSGFEYGYKIISDSDNNLVIVGSSNSNFEHVPELYVLKLNTDGTPLFEKRISGIDAVYGYDIIENNSGNYMITGTYTIDDYDKDIFLLSLDKKGDIINVDSSYQIPEGGLTIYPNPISGESAIIATFNKDIFINSLIIFDSMGRIVKEVNYSDPQYKIRLNVAELRSGYYLIKTKLSNGLEHVNKIIIY
jgi:hypothetical protein